MRTLTAILLLFASTVSGQIIPKEDIKHIMIKSGLLFVSGSFDATAEVLRIDYSRFEARFPEANQQFWNPNKSWTNKWKNGDPAQGEAFFLSSTALVWTTDAYHLMRTGRNMTMIAAVVIPIGKRKNWKQYAIEVAIYYTSYTAGFNLIYNGLYKMP